MAQRVARDAWNPQNPGRGLRGVQKQANGVLIKTKRVVDPDDTLTREESALIAKARREMKKGKHVTLARNFRDVQSLLLRGVSAERHFEHERLAPQPLSSGPSPESF